MRAALFSYVRERDVLCCRVGGRPDDPCSDTAIMAYLVPNSSGFEGRRAVNGRDVLRWARGSCRRRSVRGTEAGKAASRSRTLHCARAVATALGVWFVRAGAGAMPLAVAGMASHRPSAST
jgi:hypothetical protein